MINIWLNLCWIRAFAPNFEAPWFFPFLWKLPPKGELGTREWSKPKHHESKSRLSMLVRLKPKIGPSIFLVVLRNPSYFVIHCPNTKMMNSIGYCFRLSSLSFGMKIPFFSDFCKNLEDFSLLSPMSSLFDYFGVLSMLTLLSYFDWRAQIVHSLSSPVQFQWLASARVETVWRTCVRAGNCWPRKSNQLSAL